AAACAIALVVVATLACADAVAVKSAEIRADEDAYVVNAEFDLALNPTLEEALQKGVPLYFELEFDLVRPRKYCYDEKVLSSTTELFARRYDLLLVLSGAIVVVLMLLVGYQLWRLSRNLKAGVFGSRLAVRLVLLFALVAVLPGALVYAVSVQFLGKSIESWFDVRVDRALEGGLDLGRSSLDYLLKETANKTQQIPLSLSEGGAGSL